MIHKTAQTKKKTHSRLWLWFALIIFMTTFVVSFLISGCCLLLYHADLIHLEPRQQRFPILMTLLASILLGAVIAVFVGRLIIRPMRDFSNAFDEIANGNFNVKIQTDKGLTEIREMAQRFNTMASDLAHVETLRSDFVANVSHEFKTPLSSIEGYATLLQNPELPVKKQEYYVEKILDNSKRLSSMASDILALSKLENQEILTDYAEIRLDEQIREVILGMEPKWEKKEITFDLELPKTMYDGSGSLLLQVWSNLLDNAIKYSKQGGIIQVKIEKYQEKITVTVTDQGSGMSEEVQKHIFEKFYQGDASRKTEGNGLGLALVKRILDLCKGEIQVESEEGKGSSFCVRLTEQRNRTK